MLGGTLVSLNGPCFEETDTVECVFAGTPTPGVYVSRDSVACITPAMNAIGNVEVLLRIRVSPGGTIKYQGTSSFYSSKWHESLTFYSYLQKNVELIIMQ